MADEQDADATGAETDQTTFQRSDVYKMHTYRDALSSVHAAVAIYPGLNQDIALFSDHRPHEDATVGAAPLVPGTAYDATMLDEVVRTTLRLTSAGSAERAELLNVP